MNFAWPQLLWLLFLPAFWLGWEVTHRRRAGAAAHPHIPRAEAGPRSLTLEADPPARRGPATIGSKPRWWLGAGLALGIVALARPQWGRVDEPVFEQAREILLAVDLSRSMLTPDVKPSRLERAKLLIQSLLDKLAGERVGLMGFAGTAFLQAPMSADYEILREFLPSLGPEFMPVGGTDYGALIDAATAAFSSGGNSDRFLVILSDGAATDDAWEKHVDRLKEKGVRVIGLGVGTAAGALIPDGSGGYVKDEQGAVVMAKLESDTLRKLADLTGGAYRDASEWVDLASLIKFTIDAGRKGRFLEKNTVRYVERYQWALGPALLCLLISFYREFPVRPKPRDIQIGRGEGSEAGRAKIAVAALLGLLLPLAASALGAVTSPGAAPAPPPPGALLGRVVGRLSAADSRSALDWLELDRETLAWGQQFQSSGKPVPPGPVHDALAAAEAGAALDPKAADWPHLRDQLEALLKNPENQKQKPPPQKNQQQKPSDSKQQQQNQQQQNQQSQDQQQNQSPQDQPQNQQQNTSSQSSPQDAASKDAAKNQNGQGQSQSAFGDLKKPPQTPSGGTQQVGGTKEHAAPDPAKADPAMAPLWQKLDQIRDKDSPAELYQMFEKNEPHPPDKKGKDW